MKKILLYLIAISITTIVFATCKSAKEVSYQRQNISLPEMEIYFDYKLSHYDTVYRRLTEYDKKEILNVIRKIDSIGFLDWASDTVISVIYQPLISCYRNLFESNIHIGNMDLVIDPYVNKVSLGSNKPDVSYTYNIHADTSMFAKSVMQNPDAIISALMYNWDVKTLGRVLTVVAPDEYLFYAKRYIVRQDSIVDIQSFHVPVSTFIWGDEGAFEQEILELIKELGGGVPNEENDSKKHKNKSMPMFSLPSVGKISR